MIKTSNTENSIVVLPPPFSIYRPDMERNVLASIFVSNKAFDDICDIISVDDFYVLENKLIFESMHRLISAGCPIDFITVGEDLRKHGHLDKVGGEIELVNLHRSVPTAASVKYYAEILAKVSIDKKLLDASQEIYQSVVHAKDDRLDDAQRLVLSIAEKSITEPTLIAEDLPGVISDLIDRYDKKVDLHGVPSGFTELDRYTSGFQKGDYIVLAARPSMGKTLLALNIAEHLAINCKKPVAFFSLEMLKKPLIERIICNRANIKADNFRSGQLTQEEIERVSRVQPLLAGSPLILDAGSALSTMDIRAKSRRIKRKHGLSMIIVDYLTYIKKPDGENNTIQISNISHDLKRIALELEVPLMVLSQLNRNLENRPNKRPILADLRESGAIEQDADICLFIYRDEVYNPETTDRGIAEINIAKFRNGSTGTFKLGFEGAYCRFSNTVSTYQPVVQLKPFANSNSYKNKYEV